MKHLLLLLFLLFSGAICAYAQQQPHKYKVGDTAFCGIVFYEKMDTLCSWFSTYMRAFNAPMDTINQPDPSAGFIPRRDSLFFVDTLSCTGRPVHTNTIREIYYRDTSVTIYAIYQLYNVSKRPGAYGQHGLVCSMADQQTGAQWDTGYLATFAINDIIFDKPNAEKVITRLGNGYTYAALVAKNYASADSNCTNWYLPSKAELSLMYNNLASKAIGNFVKEGYWSSVENFDSSVYRTDSLSNTGPVIVRGQNPRALNTIERKAWLVDFFDGKTFPADKINKYHVRAVREFWIP